jgi:hypothetical protein
MIAHTAPSVHSHARLVTWLHCAHCHTGSFAAGAPIPQPSLACTGGRLPPVGVCNLRADQVLPGLLARPMAQEGCP